MKPEPAYSVRAVHRVCDILDLLRSSEEGASLTQVAASTGLPKSSALRYLATLEARKYVRREPGSGSFRGAGIMGSSIHVMLELLRRHAVPHMEALRDELGETVNLGALQGNRVKYLQIVESHRSVRLAARIGDHDLLHSTALGKAIAADLSEGHVRAILAEAGMQAYTDRTITTIDDYLRELDRVRELGFGVDDGENEPDGRCVAVAIADFPLPAALSVSAPNGRFPHEQVPTAAEALRRAARLIARELSDG